MSKKVLLQLFCVFWLGITGCNTPSETDLATLVGATDPTVTVNGPLGNSALTISPASFDFGTVTFGSMSATQSFTITNSSAFAITLQTLTNSNADFALTSNTCTNGLSMAKNATCTIVAKLNPSTTGSLSSLITIPYSDGTSTFTSTFNMTGACTTLTGFNGLDSLSNITAGKMTLNWTGVANVGSYRIYQINGASATLITNITPTAACVGTVCNTVVSGLTGGTSYTFRVRAEDLSGTPEMNIVTRTASTQNAATFSAISNLAVNEGSNAQTANLSCSDGYGSTNAFSISSVSDSDVNCSLTAATGANVKVSCTPAYKATGGTHTNWNPTVGVLCTINDVVYSRILTVNVTNTNRAPSPTVGTVTNPSPTAAVNTTTFNVNNTGTNNDTDADGDSLTYTCAFTGGAFGSSTNCSSLPGTYSLNASTGAFSWAPSAAASTSAATTNYSITITANDSQSANNTATANTTIAVQPSLLLTTVTNRTFESGKTPLLVGNALNINFNNTQEQPSAGDTSMSYTCYYDQVVDNAVATTTLCSALTNTTFNTSNGAYSFTPSVSQLGAYEFKVCGTHSVISATDCAIFVVDVASAYSTTNLLAYWDAMFGDLKKALNSTFSSWSNLVGAGTSNNGSINTSSNASIWSALAPWSLVFSGSSGSPQSVSFGDVNSSNTSSLIEAWINPTATTTASTTFISNGDTAGGKGLSFKQLPDNSVELSIGSKSYADVVLEDSPLYYYRLNDPASNNTLVNLGSVTNNPTYGSTVSLAQNTTPLKENNSSASFSGNATPIDLGSTTTLEGLAEISVEMWVYPTSNPTGASAIKSYFGKAAYGGIGTNTVYFFAQNNAGGTATTICAGVYANGGPLGGTCGTLSPPTLNAWTHIVATWKSSGFYTVYYNGTQVFQTAASSGITAAVSKNFIIGGSQYGSDQGFVGLMSDFAIFNKELSSARVSAHYAARNYYTCTSPSMVGSAWNHLIGTFDINTLTLRTFMNGQQSCSYTNGGAIVNGSTAALTIGSEPGNTNVWNGNIGAVRVYNPATLAASATVSTTNFNAEKDRFSFNNTPNQISNLKAWWKADSITGLNDGDPVSTWTDSSSNAYTATNTGTNRPTYKTNILNGKPTLRFVRTSNQYLDVGTQMGAVSPSVTYFIVAKTTDKTLSQAIMSSNPAGGGAPYNWDVFIKDVAGSGGFNTYACSASCGWRMSNTSSIVNDTFYLFSVMFSNNYPFQYINGASANNSSGGVTNTTITGTNPFAIGRMGAYSASTAQNLDGDIAEVIIYGRALTEGERKRVEAYLKAKYGL